MIEAGDNLDRNRLDFLKRLSWQHNDAQNWVLTTWYQDQLVGLCYFLQWNLAALWMGQSESQISQGEAGLKLWLWEAAEYDRKDRTQAP